MTDRAFVSHLARGGELLRGDKLSEAVDELRQALALRPGEAKVLNLLGLATFRLGTYPEAREIFKDLAERSPNDAAMRLNLGLVHLKMADVDDAIRELRRAKDLDPMQVRTLGYLGLAYARKGDFALARDAFRAAGQEDLAREMEEQLAVPPPGADAVPRPIADIVTARVVAPPRTPTPPPSSATDDMLTPIPDEPEPPPRPAARPEPPPLPELPPLPPPPPPAADAPAPPDGAPVPLAALLHARLVQPDAGDLSLQGGPGQTLVVRVRGKILSRRDGVLARGGDLAFTPALRHTRGRITQEGFGGMFVVSGTGHLVVGARGGTFTPVALAGEALYLREHVVFAFEECLGWENGQVPGSALAVVQFRGAGCVALLTKHLPVTIEIGDGRPLAVAPEALVGWTGRVVPRFINEAGAPRVECVGEGMVFVEEPSA